METKSKMTFSIKKLRDFLNKNNQIYTVRAYEYKTMNCYVPDVGNCKRELIKVIHEDDQLGSTCLDILEEYVLYSGFNNLTQWIEVIRKFTNNRIPLYLYKVEKTKENNNETINRN